MTQTRNSKRVLNIRILNLFRVSDLGFRVFQPGFTIFEAIVVIFMITIIAGIVLANFPALNQTIAIQRAGQDFSLELRKAQSMALSVRQVTDPKSGNFTIPDKYGVYVDLANPKQYILYGDIPANGGINGAYDGPTIDAMVETVMLPAGISFISVEQDVYGTPPTAITNGIVNYLVKVPLGKFLINDRNGTPVIGPNARYTLKGVAGTITRQVIVLDSGYIEVH